MLALALGFAASAAAQDGSTSAIRGVVSDSSGARVAGVQVSIINPETAFTRRAITDGEGRFRMGVVAGQKYVLMLSSLRRLLRDGVAAEVESGRSKDLGDFLLGD